MSRVQLALNVTDVDAAVEFYEKLFATPVAKRKPGYANFEIAEPPLKLVLIEGPEGGTLNHLGVETMDPADVRAAEARLSDEGLETTGVDDTVCCFAEKTETWVTDPDGAPWEWYVKNADAELMSLTKLGDESAACCAPTTSGPSTSGEPVAFGRPTASGDSSGCC
jgi:catechol 2,3-dioxygenase-like lactoylglutathione lyase family enzyme